jgi:hypothetical protein
MTKHGKDAETCAKKKLNSALSKIFQPLVKRYGSCRNLVRIL